MWIPLSINRQNTIFSWSLHQEPNQHYNELCVQGSSQNIFKKLCSGKYCWIFLQQKYAEVLNYIFQESFAIFICNYNNFIAQTNLDLRDTNLLFLNQSMFDLRKIWEINLKKGSRKKCLKYAGDFASWNLH